MKKNTYTIHTVADFKEAVDDALNTGCVLFEGTYDAWERQIECYAEYCGNELSPRAMPGIRTIKEWFEEQVIENRTEEEWKAIEDEEFSKLGAFGQACWCDNTIKELEDAFASRSADRSDCEVWEITPTIWRKEIRAALNAKKAKKHIG